MELELARRQPARETAGLLDPSHLWVLGLAIDDEGMLVGPEQRQDTNWIECECPGFCRRDHENE